MHPYHYIPIDKNCQPPIMQFCWKILGKNQFGPIWADYVMYIQLADYKMKLAAATFAAASYYCYLGRLMQINNKDVNYVAISANPPGIDLFGNCFTQFLLAHGSQCFAQNRGKTSAAYFGVVSSKTRTKKLVQQGFRAGLMIIVQADAEVLSMEEQHTGLYANRLFDQTS